MNSITMRAYAKINLGLDVLRKREDGYHDVSMIMQSIGLYDTLKIHRQKEDLIKIKTNLTYLPTDHRNIVYKAVALFKETFHIKEGVRIHIDKHIPVAAGLAGGSSDAAATLKGLNKLFQTNLSLDELKALGVKLGADVPYCLMLGTALSEGIGEILTPLSPMPKCNILLVKPDISVSTKYVYENLKLSDNSVHPDISGMLESLQQNDLHGLTSKMDNILQTVTVIKYPIIDEIKLKMKELGALTALMSGSGPTVFGIYENLEIAKNAAAFFMRANYGKTVHLIKPYQIQH